LFLILPLGGCKPTTGTETKAPMAEFHFQPTKFYVPDPWPDFGISEAEWQKTHAQRVTLPAQVFRAGEAKIEGGKSSLMGPGDRPSVWRTMAGFQEAIKEGDMRRAGEWMSAELRERMEKAMANPKNLTLIAAQNAQLLKIDVLLAVEIDGTPVLFGKGNDGRVRSTVFQKGAREYGIANLTTLGGDRAKLVADMTQLLNERPVEKMIEP
jgi:hypothetical protein